MTLYYILKKEDAEKLKNPYPKERCTIPKTFNPSHEAWDEAKSTLLSAAKLVDLDEAAGEWERYNRTYDSKGKMQSVTFSQFIEGENK